MPRKKRKTRDQWSIARWVKEAKKVFQRWVRLRDADSLGYVTCCTCGSVGHWREFDGGHFVRAHNLTVCFDERNCHAQCKKCNCWGGGEWERYSLFIKHTYGQEVLDFLLGEVGKTRKLKAWDLQEIIENYTDKCIAEEMRIG